MIVYKMLLTVPLTSLVSMVGITARVMENSIPAPCIAPMEWNFPLTLHQPTLASTEREVSSLPKFHNANMVNTEPFSFVDNYFTDITGSNMQVVKGHSSSSHSSYSLVDPASQDWHSILLGKLQL